MKNHFNDMSIDAYEHGSVVDLDFVLGELALYELLESRAEVDPRETKKMVKQIRKTLIKGGA